MQKCEVEISDFCPDVVESLLEFVYTESCSLDRDNALELLEAAEKYGIAALREKCVAALSRDVR